MSTYSNTWAISTTGLTLNPTRGESPPSTPAGLIVTRAIETKSGWVGQVIVDKDIVWESETFADVDGDESPSEAALQEANSLVVARIKALFTDGA